MRLPIKFPSDEDVIIEEVARFRALPPQQCAQSIRGLLAAGALMMRRSPRAAFLREFTLEQEHRARQAVKEFLARAMPAEHDLLADELIRAVELLADVFAARSIRYAVVGGLATLLRGRPRFTQDVDVLLDVPQLALPGLLDELARLGFAFDLPTLIREFVQEYMTSFRFGTVRIDWLKPVLPLYARRLPMLPR